MAIHTGGEPGGIFATINITPLTDIFLVLLIIFMVATAITIESAAHVDLPKLQAPALNQQPRGVTVTCTADHQIYVNQKAVSEAELALALRDALGKASDKIVLFDGDPRIFLGDMIRILDIAKSAGAERIALSVPHNGTNAGEGLPSGVPGVEPPAPGNEPAPEPVTPSGGP
jgi:biopolymer transport protein ExbD